MARYQITVECKRCKSAFYGRQLIECEQPPQIGEQMLDIKCPRCKNKTTIAKIY